MTGAADVVHYQGLPMDRLSYERLRSENMMVKSSTYGNEKTDITLWQGIGGAAKSGGTHLPPGGCYDTTPFNWKNRQLCGRLLGGADYHRPYNWDGVKGSEHVHHNTIGGPHNPAGARQWTSYYAGRNALANNAKDTGPRLMTKPLFVAPWTDRGRRGVYYLKAGFTARAEGSTKAASKGSVPKGAKFTVIGVVNSGGTLWGLNKDGKHVPMSNLGGTVPAGKPTQKVALRVASQNLPAPGVGVGGDLGNDDNRITKCVSLLKAEKLDMIGFQELGARVKAADASGFADKLMSKLGSEYGIVIPSTAWNENHIVYRKAAAEFDSQPGDFIVREGYEGKHLTQAVFGVAGKEVYFGSTQLVNDRTGSPKQYPVVLAAARKEAGSRLAVVVGDMNTEKVLSTSVWANARQTALKSTNGNMATFRSYKQTAPNESAEWLIDQIRHDPKFTCNGYTVVADLTSAGKFRQPRASDHLLVVASLTER